MHTIFQSRIIISDCESFVEFKFDTKNVKSDRFFEKIKHSNEYKTLENKLTKNH